MGLRYRALLVFSCLLIQVFSPPFAYGEKLGWGRVNMQGAIIDTACAIALESREQTIDMGMIPFPEIIGMEYGKVKKVSINLINCILYRPGGNNPKQFRVVFDGDSDGSLFALQGNVAGVFLQIRDEYGNMARPGEALPLASIIPRENILSYAMRLVSNKPQLKTGDYFSSIRFRLEYF